MRCPPRSSQGMPCLLLALSLPPGEEHWVASAGCPSSSPALSGAASQAIWESSNKLLPSSVSHLSLLLSCEPRASPHGFPVGGLTFSDSLTLTQTHRFLSFHELDSWLIGQCKPQGRITQAGHLSSLVLHPKHVFGSALYFRVV